eukprot:m.123036 g.123036  ORF g.123036 m.123036 type:complete len:390 (-) comp19687_c0_seq1:129-1298(-)
MADAKDILGTDDRHVSKLDKILEKKKQSKRAAEAAEERKKAPQGLHKELFELTGGRTPIAPSSGYSAEKAQLGVKKTAKKWVQVEFENHRRKDGLRLRHWVPESAKDDPRYAKTTSPVLVPTYTDAEYQAHLIDPLWTYEETNLLMSLCREFDVRFVIVQDRYLQRVVQLDPRKRKEKHRSIEDLKARYYGILTKLGEVRKDDTLCPFRYDRENEELRKLQMQKLYGRTRAQYNEEQSLIADMQRIEQRKRDAGDNFRQIAGELGDIWDVSRRRETKKRKDAANKASAIASDPGLQSAPIRAASNMPLDGVHLRSTLIARELVIRPKQLPMVQAWLADLGFVREPLPTPSVAAAYNELRADIVRMLNLQQAIRAKELELQELERRKAQA